MLIKARYYPGVRLIDDHTVEYIVKGYSRTDDS